MKNKTISIDVEIGARSDPAALRTASIEAFNLESQIELEEIKIEEGIGFTDSTILTYVISFGVSVASSVVASLIFSLIGPSARRFFVGKRRVKPDLESLEQAIETEITAASRRQQSQEDKT